MFDIEPVSLGVSILLVIGFIAPLYIYKRKQSKKASYQKNLFNETEKTLGLTCDVKDFWRDYYAIGLDSDHKMLVYIKFEQESLPQVFDLRNYDSITQIQRHEEIKTGNIRKEITNFIGLKLNVQNSNQKETILEFYDGDLFSDHQGEGPLAAKWKDLIKQSMQKKGK
ncbi:hypothetical protein [Shivajiella indica]|uniref:Uncharacterized protein n=1 Tax=Shivajiella indica TaxID=872115 RepID=A0ABW5B909_9BACT